MKYIVVEVTTKDIVRELPFIFPEAIVHSQMYKYMQHQMTMEHNADSVRCVAAGFLSSIQVGFGVECHGESESLNIKSREQVDTDLITMLDYNHGIQL